MASAMVMMNNPTEMMSREEEKMMEHHSRLSANAAPFHPYTFCDVNATIYNDGLPSMIMDAKDVVHGIQDEALDEEFPPDAQEAAELEAVEVFVEILAQLSLLEDMEERSRVDFHHIKKRWEARRQEGLKTRPRAAKEMLDRSDHSKNQTNLFSSQCRSLVPHSHHHHHDKKMMHQESMRRHEPTKNKMPVMPTTHRPMIQQPRKQS